MLARLWLEEKWVPVEFDGLHVYLSTWRVFFDHRPRGFSDSPWVFEAPQKGFSAPLLVFLSPKGVFLTSREGI